MKRLGPLATLLAGLLLGLFVLSLNATTGEKTASSSGYRPPDTKVSPKPSATSASPSPTNSPTKSPTKPPPAPVPDADYAGRTDDDSASVAVTTEDGRAVAYYCDGRTREAWLKGDVEDDGSMRLIGKNGAELNGTLKEGKRISGTVAVVGARQAFTADRTKEPALYRATTTVNGTETDGGWIVQGDGTQVGILNRAGTPSPAPRIDPGTGAVTIDGRQLTARPVTP
ncbi:hypothetical protein [Streptomyces sp. NPDC001658]